MIHDHASRNRATRRRIRTRLYVAAALVAAAGLAWPSAPVEAGAEAGECPAPTIETFLLEGDDAPGSGAAFQTFDRPNIGESGHVCFAGDTGGPTDADDVVYVNTTLVAREGDPAPDVPGGTYSVFEFFETGHQVNAGGDAAYIATLRDVPTTANRAVYGNATLVAREGDGPPGIAGRLYADFGFAGVTDDGRVGYLADLDGSTSDDSVIFLGGVVLYREGDAVPVLPGETWDGNFDEIQLNGAGDVLFEGNTSLASGDMVVYRRLDVVSGGVVEEIVAQEGQAVDANTGPDFLELVLQTSLAENGQWGLRGNLGVAPSTADAVILTEVGFYAQQGDPVPELPGVVLGNFNGIDINGVGDVLYLADLEGATPAGVDEGLFVNGCLIVTDGVQVPGQPENTDFSDLGFEDLYINDTREVVFAASYTGAVTGDGLFTFALAEGACPEDLTGPNPGDPPDGVVNVFDLLALLANFGTAGPLGDITGPGPGDPPDGVVDAADLAALLTTFGAPCPAPP